MFQGPRRENRQKRGSDLLRIGNSRWYLNGRLYVERLQANFPSEALDIHMYYVAPSPARSLPSAVAGEHGSWLCSLAGLLFVLCNRIHFVSMWLSAQINISSVISVLYSDTHMRTQAHTLLPILPQIFASMISFTSQIDVPEMNTILLN